jgi:hypothetical protein
LRSATVNLGAVTVLALSLTGCNNFGDDDDDCALGPAPTVATATLLATAAAPAAPETAEQAVEQAVDQDGTEALPARGGFGTHLAYGCGG